MADLGDFQAQGRARLSIEGLWCPSCAAAVERKIRSMPGVIEVGVSFATTSATLEWNPAQLNLLDLAAQVKKLGYRLAPPVDSRETLSRIDEQIQRLSIRLAVSVFFSVWIMAFSLVLYIDDGIGGTTTGLVIAYVIGALAIPVMTFCAAPIFMAGWRTLRMGIPGMDTLVSLGALSAFGISAWQLVVGHADVYFDTAVMLITLLTLSRFIETRTLRQSSEALDALQSTIPESATRLDAEGNAESVTASSVAIGEVIRIAAGERIPLDGVLIDGSSYIDRAVLTGESHPLSADKGDRVEAGCVNLLSPVSLRVEATVGERRIDQIGLRIAEAAGAKSETQRLADRFAGWLVPAALLAATLTFVFVLQADHAPREALLRALSVLVVACPCAMAMAIPLVYVMSARQAARHRVLFRTPRAFEHLARARCVFFDKTGTLTEGKLSLTDIHIRSPDAGFDRHFVLQLVAAMEQDIAHPVAQALVAAGKRSSGGELEVSGLNVERAERGVICQRSEWGRIVLGNAAFLMQQGIDCEVVDSATPETALTLQVELAIEDRWVASLTLEDRLHEDAREVIAWLQTQGIRCAIVSGDRLGAVQRVGVLLGLQKEDLHAECSPQEKAEIVKAAGRGTVFVGDGINDGPALATAETGIAVASAVSTAVASAGVVVQDEGVTRIAAAIAFAQRARARMLQNIVFSMGYNALALSLAAMGAVPPLAAAVAMLLSSLTVIINSSRSMDFNADPATREYVLASCRHVAARTPTP